MHRRDFLIGAASSIASLLHAEHALAQPKAGQHRFIDAHCHIFNLKDLSAEGFLKKVILPTNREMRRLVSRYPAVADVFVDHLNTRLRGRAPNDLAEMASIEKLESGESPASSFQRRVEDIEFLKSFFSELFEFKFARERKLRFGDRFVTGYAIGYLERKLVEEAFPLVANPTRPVDEGGVNYQQNNYTPLAERLYASNGPAGRHIRWAFLFTRSRFELADELSGLYSGRAVLLTPALVDFGAWLQDEPPVSIARQVDVMHRISLRKRGPRVHGFVAFDPLRQAVHEKHGRSEQDSPLNVVKRAIEEKGFIGVKLYPPMGFRATNNAQAGTDFPEHVRFGPDGLGSEPGKTIDAIMDRLYEWAVARNVPIMAHAANSNEAGPGYGTRAHPRQWARVLSKYPALRINMAHFGGFEERGNPARPDNTWEWAIGRLFAEAPDSYIYADISHFNEIIDTDTRRRNQILADLKTFRGTFKQCAAHLIYGSDWTMVGREANFSAAKRTAYPDRIADFLEAAGFSADEVDAILFKNAARFFGLLASDRESGTRGRLENFYEAAGLDAEWLKNFDTS